MTPGVAVAFDTFIDGNGFIFQWGSSYSVKLTTSEGDQYTFWTGYSGINVRFVSLNTTTAAILNMTNTGPPTIKFNAYSVEDPLGHWSNDTSWSGPTVKPGMALATNIVINGSIFTFQSGKMYAIRLFVTTCTEWTIYLTPP